MVKNDVLFEVRTEYLNIISASEDLDASYR
jgi:hypothetical protein